MAGSKIFSQRFSRGRLRPHWSYCGWCCDQLQKSASLLLDRACQRPSQSWKAAPGCVCQSDGRKVWWPGLTSLTATGCINLPRSPLALRKAINFVLIYDLVIMEICRIKQMSPMSKSLCKSICVLQNFSSQLYFFPLNSALPRSSGKKVFLVFAVAVQRRCT